MKTLKQVAFGAIVGGIFGFALVKGFKLPIYDFSTEMMVVLLILSSLLSIFSLIGLSAIKKKASQSFSGVDEDLRDEWQYKKYSDVSLASSIAIIISIITMCIGIITEQGRLLIIISLIVIFLSCIASTKGSTIIKYVYPDRNFPDTNSKNYSLKIFNMADEGERHVMLKGLYSAFNMTNILLIFSLLILLAYSVVTGNSQLFAILIIGLIFIIINTDYILRVRNKS